MGGAEKCSNLFRLKSVPKKKNAEYPPKNAAHGTAFVPLHAEWKAKKSITENEIRLQKVKHLMQTDFIFIAI